MKNTHITQTHRTCIQLESTHHMHISTPNYTPSIHHASALKQACRALCVAYMRTPRHRKAFCIHLPSIPRRAPSPWQGRPVRITWIKPRGRVTAPPRSRCRLSALIIEFKRCNSPRPGQEPRLRQQCVSATLSALHDRY